MKYCKGVPCQSRGGAPRAPAGALPLDSTGAAPGAPRVPPPVLPPLSAHHRMPGIIKVTQGANFNVLIE